MKRTRRLAVSSLAAAAATLLVCAAENGWAQDGGAAAPAAAKAGAPVDPGKAQPAKPAVAGTPLGGTPESGVGSGKETLWELIVLGGVVMIPLGLCSILGVAIGAERLLSLREDKIIPPGFLEGLRAEMKRSGGDAAGPIQYCENVGGAVGEIFKAALSRMHKGDAAVEKAIEDTGYREAEKLKRSLRGLAALATVSPLLGLLGTVYGMISAFQVATLAGVGRGDVLARGIYEALVTTAAGLTIAIPVVVVQQYLLAKVDTLVDKLDSLSLEFMHSCVDNRDQD